MDHLQKTKKEYKIKKKKTRYICLSKYRYIYQNELDKACFQHDMAYGDFKGLSRRTTSDKKLHDKAFNIAKNSKYDGYQCGLGSMVYNFFDKKTAGGSAKNENMTNQDLTEELHKPTIRKLKKRKVYSSFIDNFFEC